MVECEKNTVKTSPFNEGIDNKGKNTLRIKISAVAHSGAPPPLTLNDLQPEKYPISSWQSLAQPSTAEIHSE